MDYNITTNDEKEKNDNLLEFLESRINKKIQPLTKYNYKLDNQKIWWWDDLTNDKSIEMTVALPAFNSEKILWLSLESLKNQININFAWELICFEEHGKSRNLIKSYVGKLPGCARIVHKDIDPCEGIYNIGKYTLIEKWLNIAKYANDSSKIFVKHASDDYSPSKRLYIHYEHFKNPTCYYSTQTKGYFYHIHFVKYFLYDGYVYNNYFYKSKNIKITSNHLNNALRTKNVREISLPKEPIFSGIDRYMFTNLLKIININPMDKKIIYTDDEIDPENWKQGFFTDGYNTISLNRKRNYLDKRAQSWKTPIKYPNDLKIPEYIFEKLKLMK